MSKRSSRKFQGYCGRFDQETRDPEYDLRLKRSKYLYRMLYGDEPVSGQEAVNVVKQIFHGIALSELAKKQAAEERTKLLEAEPAEEAE